MFPYHSTPRQQPEDVTMEPILVLAAILFAASAVGAAECETGWQLYKNELCIKTFPSTFLSYDEANDFCTIQGNELSKSSLAMIKEAGMQEFLVNSTNDIYDNLWLGGRYDDETEQFKRDDGEDLTYTNWQEGSPRNDADSNICIEMKPINAKLHDDLQGKWADVNCNKRNLVICQRGLSWTLHDAISEIIKVRKQLETTQQNLESTQQNLETVTKWVVPIGSIYVEYYGQPNPRSLWPDLTWQDVSSTYAGLFFRVSGGAAAGWGANQTACAPRINESLYGFSSDYNFGRTHLQIPANGPSDYAWVGRYDTTAGTQYYEGLQFTTAGCEVRPVNQAVRIWKRIAYRI